MHHRKHLDGHGHGRQRSRFAFQQHDRGGRPRRVHLTRRREPRGDVHRDESQRRKPQRHHCCFWPGDRAIDHRARGFTLAEVLVATAVLAVGLVAIATGFQYATSGVAVGGGESTAVFLAEQRVEQLRADAMSDFSAPSLGPGTTTEYCAPAIIAGRTSTCQDTAGAGASYVRRTTISDVTGSMGCPARPVWCKQVEVRVGYRPVTSTGELNQAREIDVITVLGPRA
ncbi:MAG: hypothetical protein DME02_17050 [Candidatus Rokuibacteriota bacterium]|nr:MAG: hypothetical protein DME02_17050 [Candidatus Rokubacteria bacterium]